VSRNYFLKILIFQAHIVYQKYGDNLSVFLNPKSKSVIPKFENRHIAFVKKEDVYIGQLGPINFSMKRANENYALISSTFKLDTLPTTGSPHTLSLFNNWNPTKYYHKIFVSIVRQEDVHKMKLLKFTILFCITFSFCNAQEDEQSRLNIERYIFKTIVQDSLSSSDQLAFIKIINLVIKSKYRGCRPSRFSPDIGGLGFDPGDLVLFHKDYYFQNKNKYQQSNYFLYYRVGNMENSSSFNEKIRKYLERLILNYTQDPQNYLITITGSVHLEKFLFLYIFFMHKNADQFKGAHISFLNKRIKNDANKIKAVENYYEFAKMLDAKSQSSYRQYLNSGHFYPDYNILSYYLLTDPDFFNKIDLQELNCEEYINLIKILNKNILVFDQFPKEILESKCDYSIEGDNELRINNLSQAIQGKKRKRNINQLLDSLFVSIEIQNQKSKNEYKRPPTEVIPARYPETKTELKEFDNLLKYFNLNRDKMQSAEFRDAEAKVRYIINNYELTDIEVDKINKHTDNFLNHISKQKFSYEYVIVTLHLKIFGKYLVNHTIQKFSKYKSKKRVILEKIYRDLSNEDFIEVITATERYAHLNEAEDMKKILLERKNEMFLKTNDSEAGKMIQRIDNALQNF